MPDRKQLAGDVLLDGKRYRLLSDPASGAKAWDMRSEAIIGAPDSPIVQATNIPFLYEAVWDDFRGGYGAQWDARPRRYFFTNGCVAQGREIVPTPEIQLRIHQLTIWPKGQFSGFFKQGEIEFQVTGRFALRLDTADIQDLVNPIESVAMFEGEAYFAHGSGANFRNRDAGGTINQADITANHFAVTSDGRLWRAYTAGANVALIANVAAGADPLTAGNWSGGITVGDPGAAITKLIPYGPFIIVCKETGPFAATVDADTYNLAPELLSSQDPDNGRGSYVWGGKVYFPFVGGMIVYNGSVINDAYPEFIGQDERQPAQGRIVALAGDNTYLYAIMSPSLMPRVHPSGFYVTRDNGSTYTNETSDVSDDDASTDANLDALDNRTAGHWVIIGSESRFEGIIFKLDEVNSNTVDLYVQTSDGAGGWNNTYFHDGTVVGTVSFAKDGAVTFSPEEGDWNKDTYEAQNLYWIRVWFFSPLSATVRVLEAYVVKQDFAVESTSVRGVSSTSMLIRGRRPEPGIIVDGDLVWDTIGPIHYQDTETPTGRKIWHPRALTLATLAIKVGGAPGTGLKQRWLIMASFFNYNPIDEAQLAGVATYFMMADSNYSQRPSQPIGDADYQPNPRVYLTESDFGFAEHEKLFMRVSAEITGQVTPKYILDGGTTIIDLAALTAYGKKVDFAANVTGKRIMPIIDLESAALRSFKILARVMPDTDDAIMMNFLAADNIRFANGGSDNRTHATILKDLNALLNKEVQVDLKDQAGRTWKVLPVRDGYAERDVFEGEDRQPETGVQMGFQVISGPT